MHDADLLRQAHALLTEARDLVWTLAIENAELRAICRSGWRKVPRVDLPGWVSRAVDATFGVSRQTLLTSGRAQHLTHARFAAATLLAENGWSSIAIGSALQRDHTTILHALTRAKEMAAVDPTFRAKMQQLRDVARAARVAQGIEK